jgi:hypothetical protein
MKKILLEEINRVREIMGLKLISEAVGPKPRTVGGILLNALIDGAGKLKPQNVTRKIESQLSASGNKDAKKTADLIKSLADDVKEGISKSQDFEAALVKYLDPLELNFLVRNIGKNSTEVLDNYITATVMFDDKIYKEFVDMVGKGEKLADERIKDYIERTALANPNFYDVPTLERMWSDIESGQFKYADEAGISVPGRKTKPEEPGFKVDVEGIKDTDGPKIGSVSDSEVKIIIGTSDDAAIKKAEELIDTEIRKYLETDLRFKGANVEKKNEIIEQIQKTVRERFPKETEKFEDIGFKMENIVEEVWKQKIKPSDKIEIINKAFDELKVKFNWTKDNMFEWVKRDLSFRDPMTGRPIGFREGNTLNAIKRYLIWNTAILVAESGINWIMYQQEDPNDWGADWKTRFDNYYDPVKIARLFLPIPSIWNFLVSKGVKAVGGTSILLPDNRPVTPQELIENEEIKKYFGAVGDIIVKKANLSPDMDGDKQFDEITTFVTDKDGKNYGLWTYNNNTNKAELYRSPKENAALLPSTPSVTVKYENSLESFKQWLTDKSKTDRGAAGPDSNGIFTNGVIEYKFVDKTTGFKSN